MNNGPSGSSPGKSEVKLELAFEYLMSKDRLQWVTITSPQVELLCGGLVRGRAGLALHRVWEGCEVHRAL